MTTSNSTLSINTTAERWLRLAHVLWYPTAVVALAIFIASIPGYIQLIPQGFADSERFAINPSLLVKAFNILTGLLSVITVLLSLYLSLVLFRRRPKDRMALFLSYYLLVYGILAAGPLEVLKHFIPGVAEQTTQVLILLIILPSSIFLFALFPDGRFVPGWTRWLGLASFLVVPVIIFTFPAFSLDYSNPRPLTLSVIGYLITFSFLFSMLYAQVHRYRNVSTRLQRMQTKWVVYGIGVVLTLMLISSIPRTWSYSLPPGTPFPEWGAAELLIYFLSLTIIPVSLTIAVMRYRLYDIDILINRTLVYGVLTAIVVGLYVLVVGAVSIGFQTNNKLAGALLTTILVGVFFKPLRARMQRGVDRLMYGKNGRSPPIQSQQPSEDIQTYLHPVIEPEETIPSSLSRGWLRVAHGAWYLAAAVALSIFIASLPGYIWLIPRGFTGDRFAVNPAPLVLAFNVLFVLLSISSALVSLFLALLLFRRRSEERMVLFLSFYLLAHGILLSGPFEMLETFWPGVARLTSTMLLPLIFFPLSYFLFAVFPDGRFVPGWTRWCVIATVMFAPVFLFFTTSLTTYQPDLSNPLILIAIVITFLFSIPLFFSLLYAQIYRYRQVSTQKQRQQTKWVIYGVGVWFSFLLISSIFWIRSYSLPPGTPFPLWMAATQPLWGLSTAIFPVSLTIAVLRYRLYDIDILINRTLVYGVLTASTMGIYVFVVGYLGNLLQAQDKSIIAFLTTGLVALVFQPFRERLQRVVNRLMYGERDNPMSVLLKLGKQLEGTVSPDSALTGVVEMVAQALKLPYVAISLRSEGEYKVIEEYGQPASEPIELPLLYQAETVGQLIVSPRSPGESFNADEMELLRNISRQFGAAAQSVRLTVDLQRSRERLAITLGEERRRLRRDLHDGLGASLAALHLQMGVLKRMIQGDPEQAEAMVEEFRVELREGINEIRRVVYHLRPPALDELGLVAALRAQAERFSGGMGRHANHAQDQSMDEALEIRVEAPDTLPLLPAAVEVAAYRIVQEALTNVVQHSQARVCVVQLALDGDLNLKVSDDGTGIGEYHKTGIGLHSMRERAEELGGRCVIEPAPEGGTLVWVRLPIPKE